MEKIKFSASGTEPSVSEDTPKVSRKAETQTDLKPISSAKTNSTSPSSASSGSNYSFTDKSPNSDIARPSFPPEHVMSKVESNFDTYNTKYYNCGFLYKIPLLNTSGMPTELPYEKYWVELWGPVLHQWLVPKELATFQYSLSLPEMIKNELDPSVELIQCIKLSQPQYINISDSIVYQYTKYPYSIKPPIPYTCYFGICNQESNLFVFACGSEIQLNHWLNSIALSLYELSKIYSKFTSEFLLMNSLAYDYFKVPRDVNNYRDEIKFEGRLQIRIPFSNIWKQYHVLVTSKYGDDAYQPKGKIRENIFGKQKLSTDLSKRGSIWFFESEKDKLKGKPPLFSMEEIDLVQAIWPNECDLQKLNLLQMCKFNGKFKLCSLKSLEDLTVERGYDEDGVTKIKTIEDFALIVQGIDHRPVNDHLLIMAPNAFELSKWIIALHLSFGLPFENSHLNQHSLCLSLEEIGGITYKPHRMFPIFNHYLEQKLQFQESGKMQIWKEEITKGEWERGVNDRKELEYKFKQLMEWKEVVKELLQAEGYVIKDNEPRMLIKVMSSLIPWLEPVLSSMIAEVSSPEPIKTEKSKTPGVQITESENSDGSVSEESRSSEGSQSDDEEVENIKPIQPAPLPIELESTTESESDSEKDDFQVYQPNSLLAQVSEPQKTRLTKGPFIRAGEQHKFIHSENSLLYSHQRKMSLDEPHRPYKNEPLLRVNDQKVKDLGGLLGEMDRMKNSKGAGRDLRVDSILSQMGLILNQMNNIVHDGVMKILILQLQGLLDDARGGYRSEDPLNVYQTPDISWRKESTSSGSFRKVETTSDSGDDLDIPLVMLKNGVNSGTESSKSQSLITSSSDSDSDSERPLGEIAGRSVLNNNPVDAFDYNGSIIDHNGQIYNSSVIVSQPMMYNPNERSSIVGQAMMHERSIIVNQPMMQNSYGFINQGNAVNHNERASITNIPNQYERFSVAHQPIINNPFERTSIVGPGLFQSDVPSYTIANDRNMNKQKPKTLIDGTDSDLGSVSEESD